MNKEERRETVDTERGGEKKTKLEGCIERQIEREKKTYKEVDLERGRQRWERNGDLFSSFVTINYKCL